MLSSMLRSFKYRPLQVIGALLIYGTTAPFLPLALHQGLYTVSLFIKDLLTWLLPLTVGFFLAHTLSSFKQRAPLFILTLALFEAMSNFSTVWYAYVTGEWLADYVPFAQPHLSNAPFSALWRVPFLPPRWWSPDKGVLVGSLVGCIAAWLKKEEWIQWISEGKKWAETVLTRFFSRLIPLFVLGFAARMYQTRVVQTFHAHESLLLIWLVVLLAFYIGVLFLLSNRGSLKKALQAVRNLLPAGAMGFTSGCSLSTMPWTIAGTAKNLKKGSFAQAVIPATTNIQQIGDCIANAFLCFLIYRHFYGQNPGMGMWFQFSVVFVLARFATAAVLGGAIFIMLPLYERYLSFNPEMTALILAFNVLLDPLITASNIIANGALCQVYETVWLGLTKRLRRHAPPSSPDNPL